MLDKQNFAAAAATHNGHAAGEREREVTSFDKNSSCRNQYVLGVHDSFVKEVGRFLVMKRLDVRKLSLKIGANLWPNDERGVILTWSLNENFGSLLILKFGCY